MSYTDLRDFEPEFVVTLNRPGTKLGTVVMTVQLEKSGGGTVGRFYTGKWRYKVFAGTQVIESLEVIRGQDFESAQSFDHKNAADAIADCSVALSEEFILRKMPELLALHEYAAPAPAVAVDVDSGVPHIPDADLSRMAALAIDTCITYKIDALGNLVDGIGKIAAIKHLRDAVHEKTGSHSGLKWTKEYIEKAMDVRRELLYRKIRGW